MPSSKRTMRSECPVGFEPVHVNDSVDCPAFEDVLSGDEGSSLWLIKVPHNFDVSSLSGQNVILNGSQDLPSTHSNKSKDKSYEVLSKAVVSAELSSFTVLLPSSQKKRLCAASSISGQMSVIRSVSVPPATLPGSSDSLTVQRQSHSEYIKKWKPFGYRKPWRKLKDTEKAKEPSECHKESANGAKKHKKERKTVSMEEASVVDDAEKANNKGKKKKKKDRERDEFDVTRVKSEPEISPQSEITTTNGEQGSHSGRKRKIEMNVHGEREDNRDVNKLESSKQRKESKSKNMDIVKVKQELANDAEIGGENSVSELHDDFDLAPVKSEPRETPKKAKKHRK